MNFFSSGILVPDSSKPEMAFFNLLGKKVKFAATIWIFFNYQIQKRILVQPDLALWIELVLEGSFFRYFENFVDYFRFRYGNGHQNSWIK